MKLDLYQVDAFTDEIFRGNPACVVPLEHWLDDRLLLDLAKENAVAETAYFIMQEEKILLRWFTPEIEMDLCGHATLATAYILKTVLSYPKEEIIFETLSGDLRVWCNEQRFTMDLPARKPVHVELPQIISDSLNIQPLHVLKSRDYILVYPSEKDIRDIEIDRNIFDQINLDPGGIAVTAIGEESDFVSRFFSPQSSILEDPVTGSSHCSLIPYWSERFGKKEMMALQLSDRQGKLYCSNQGDRVHVGGTARLYSKGTIWTA